MARVPRVYQRRTIGPESFGPDSLRPFVDKNKRWRRSWACLVPGEDACGHFLLKEGTPPAHLCETVMAWSTKALATSWALDERLAHQLGTCWPLPGDSLALEDWANSIGLRMRNLPPPILDTFLPGLEDAYIGFAVDRMNDADDMKLTMHALMEPVDTEWGYWKFTDSYWQMEATGPLTSRVPWINRTQQQVEDWYRRVLVGSPVRPSSKVSRRFRELESDIRTAMVRVREKMRGEPISVTDVLTELDLMGLGHKVPRSSLYEWHARGYFSLDSTDPL